MRLVARSVFDGFDDGLDAVGDDDDFFKTGLLEDIGGAVTQVRRTGDKSDGAVVFFRQDAVFKLGERKELRARQKALLPVFRLSAWPHRYPIQSHLYAIAAHAVYGAVVASTFAALGRAATPATAALGSLWLTRRVPRLVRPTARRAVTRGLRVALPVRDAWLALS